MNDVIQFGESNKTMSSREISEITGKAHNDVMKAIRKMEPAWNKVAGGNFSLGSYTDKNGQNRPCFFLSKKECLFIATKFNDEARAKLVLRWEALESGQEKPMMSKPQTTAEIILAQSQLLVEQERRMLEIENKQQQMEEKISEIAVRTKTDIQYSTIVGFAKRYGIELPLEKASTLGTVSKNLCKQYLLETGKVPDPRFGTVNTYPDSVLYETFEKYYPSIRFR